MKINPFFLFILLVSCVSAIGTFNPANYNYLTNVTANFTSVNNETDIIYVLPWNTTGDVMLGRVDPAGCGYIISNGTSPDGTNLWYQDFWIDNMNYNNTQNSTILINNHNYGNNIAMNFTLYIGNRTNLGCSFQNLSGAVPSSTYGFYAIDNLTSGDNFNTKNLTELVNSALTGLKTGITGVNNIQSGIYATKYSTGSTNFTNENSWHITKDFSASCWVKPESAGSYVMFMSLAPTSSSLAWEMRKNPGDQLEVYGGDGGVSLTTAGTLSNDQLYYIGFRNNGTNSAVVINDTITTGTLNAVNTPFTSNSYMCLGQQAFGTNVCTGGFGGGISALCKVILKPVDFNWFYIEHNQKTVYWSIQNNSAGSITFVSPTNTNYTTFNIPLNITTSSSLFSSGLLNITDSEFPSGIPGLTSVPYTIGTYYTNVINFTSRGNQWINVIFSNSSTTFNANQSFYIFMGLNATLQNGGNFTGLIGWNLTIRNSTYQANFTNLINPTLIDFPLLPLGNNLIYSFQPNSTDAFEWYYPQSPYNNGTLTPSNSSLILLNGTIYHLLNFSAQNSSGQIQSWTLNATYNNGTTAQYLITNFNQTFSLSQFIFSAMTFSAFTFGYGNQSFSQTFNGSQPYLNYFFNFSLAGLNITSVKDIFTLALTTANWTASNSTFSYSGFYNLTPLFTNFSILPNGINTVTFRNSGYYISNYLVTLNPFVIQNLQAYMLNITDPYAIAVTFYIKSNTGIPLTSATVQLQQLIGGNYVSVGSGLTDGTGGITFYMDRSLTYNVIASYQSLGTTINNFVPANNQYTIYLGGSPSNYTPPFANFSYDYNPKTFQIANTSNLIPFNCSYIDSNGALLYWGLNLYATNSSGVNFTLIYSTNVTSSATGGIAPVLVNASNYTSLIMTCFWKRASDLNETDFNYTYFTSNFDSSLGLYGALQNLNEPQGSGVNWFIDFIVNAVLIGVCGLIPNLLETDYGAIIFVIVDSLITLAIGFVPIITVGGMILVFFLMFTKVAR